MVKAGILGIILLMLLAYFTWWYQRQLGKNLSPLGLMKGTVPFFRNHFLSTVIFLLLAAVMVLTAFVSVW